MSDVKFALKPLDPHALCEAMRTVKERLEEGHIGKRCYLCLDTGAGLSHCGYRDIYRDYDWLSLIEWQVIRAGQVRLLWVHPLIRSVWDEVVESAAQAGLPASWLEEK